MYIVTGGAGFIGSNIIQGLNQRGIKDILVVDNVKNIDKMQNLIGKTFVDIMPKEEFLIKVINHYDFGMIEGISHQGACSDTMETNGQYIMSNNYEYTKQLIRCSMDRKIPMVYASSASIYGNSKKLTSGHTEFEPLNLYAFSKYLIENHIRKNYKNPTATLVGLRYFNVYGPGEKHKKNMASSVYQFYKELKERGQIKLFGATDAYAAGEQKRDFIYIDDVVDINLHFLMGEFQYGNFDVGTGCPVSFNDLAKCILNEVGGGELQYIDFPETLVGRYQFYTKADLSALRKGGYREPLIAMKDGIKKYIEILNERGL